MYFKGESGDRLKNEEWNSNDRDDSIKLSLTIAESVHYAMQPWTETIGGTQFIRWADSKC